MAEESAPARRRLDRPSELVDLDKTRDNPWWRRWFRGGHHFKLVQDDKVVAAVSTLMRRDDSFGKGVRCRRTETRFADGDRWVILTHAPGPRQDKEILGFRYKEAWYADARVVDVVSSGNQKGQLAHLASRPDNNPVEVNTTDGGTVMLDHFRKRATGDLLTITKEKGRYLLTPTSMVPLEAALLHWHLLLGDFHVPQSSSGG